MKTNVFILLLFAFAATSFGQVESGNDKVDEGEKMSKEVIPNKADKMALEDFKKLPEVKGHDLTLLEDIAAKDISPCDKEHKSGNCYTAVTTKWESCKTVESKVQQGYLEFGTLSYAGCNEIEGAVKIALVAEELPAPADKESKKE